MSTCGSTDPISVRAISGTCRRRADRCRNRCPPDGSRVTTDRFLALGPDIKIGQQSVDQEFMTSTGSNLFLRAGDHGVAVRINQGSGDTQAGTERPARHL